MSQSSMISDWVAQFNDPFAILGVSVTADERRIQKRYRAVAMRLHPDRFTDADESTQDLTSKLFARLVNPAYEKLRQDKERQESLVILRLQTRRLTKDGPLNPKSDLARKLLACPVSNVDVFYEQAVVQLADTQFNPHENFAFITEQLVELNLVYLQLKAGDLGGVVQPKRTGLVAADKAKPIPYVPPKVDPQIAAETYDECHYRRAKEYARKGAWSQVVQELRDALKIKADKSQYHSLMGVAYLNLDKPLPGMAKVHLKRALELNPQDPYGLKFGPKLGLVVASSSSTQPPSKQPTTRENNANQAAKKKGLFGLFSRN